MEPIVVTVTKITVDDAEFGRLTKPDYDMTSVERWEKMEETDTTMTIRIYSRD